MNDINLQGTYQHASVNSIRDALRLELRWAHYRWSQIQVDTYVRLYNEQKKGHDDNPTIGLALCSEKSEAVVKYSVLADNQKLIAAKYLPYLPTEQELKVELERERARVVAQLTRQREVGDDK